jgi:trehalose 6-phosphate synthase
MGSSTPSLKPGLSELTRSQKLAGGDDDMTRLVVVSNRVAEHKAMTQTGGLAVALAQALSDSGGLWFGWSGDISPAAHSKVRIEKIGPLTRATIDLTETEEEGYYSGFANGSLWPALHYRLDLAHASIEQSQTYFSVNARFADSLVPLLGEHDTIWVHDYHLIPLGQELRRRGVKCRIGFFLHTPFPSPEIFAAVPHQARLGAALMSYDLVGFQTHNDCDNFKRYVEQILSGKRLGEDRLCLNGRYAVARPYPIGMDVDGFHAIAENAAQDLAALGVSPDEKIVIGVDRLDYTKGLPERLLGFQRLLEHYPEHRGKVRFIQVAPPTRQNVSGYDELRNEVEALVGHINGAFGDLTWTPVSYLHRALPHKTLAALFRASSVGLVTPLRDGMNLVAKEFVAAQNASDPGVLVLSRFAGAAEQLEDAVLINPHDADEMARALDRALTMKSEERRVRHARLFSVIEDSDISSWRDAFLSHLAETDDSGMSLKSRVALGTG